MAVIVQSNKYQDIIFQKESTGSGDVLFRSPLRFTKLVAVLRDYATSVSNSSSATINIFGGETEGSQNTLLATISLSSVDAVQKYDIYNTHKYISANITALAGQGANVTVSVKAMEE